MAVGIGNRHFLYRQQHRQMRTTSQCSYPRVWHIRGFWLLSGSSFVGFCSFKRSGDSYL